MPALMEIKLPYNWEAKADNNELRKAFPKLYEEDGKPKCSWSIGSLIIDAKEMSLLNKHEIFPEVHRFKGVVPAGLPETSAEIVHIHLPNYALSAFTKVILLEDCCTDILQTHLDEGWRIIAICPPLNKRRPDYILAKEK